MRFTLIVSCLLICCSAAHARTIGVPGDASTIQAGINAASAGDTVLVQPGRHFESIDFKGKNIVVGSLFLATRDSSYILDTIIDAEQKNTVVTFQNGETSKAELCGFTLTNGLSRGSVIDSGNPGGGICCINASPYLNHLIVEGNESRLQGGGMYLEKSNSVIEYCVIRNNYSISSGGGLYLYKGDQKISNCIIDKNEGYPTGVYCLKSKVHFYKVIMINSQFDDMILSSSSEISIINCTISNNSSAFTIDYSDVTIINSIFWNNSSQINILRGDSSLPVSHVVIVYSDMQGGINQIKGVNDSLYYDNTNINSDPLFLDIANNNYSFDKKSPCINSGIAFYKMRNIELNLTEKEYYGIAPDMGAFESNYTSTIVNENNLCPISLSNFPNPFNYSTAIQFSLSQPGRIIITIYTVSGQKVIDLLEKNLKVGKYQAQWNGKDTFGNIVSSGVYIIRLDAGLHSLSKRTLYMK